jgi:XTP/dITP diphosphohydrolase
MRVVLATGNAGKLKELQQLLTPLRMEVLPKSAFHVPEVAETGLSFVENAILKARHASQHTGLPAIADDSGIEVDALKGAPGIYSARYARQGASDEENLRKLLAELQGVPIDQRTARYRCALVFMRWDLDPAPLVCQASWEGRILQAPRGTGGFGYDPVFELPERRITAAELPADEKNSLSHRGKALQLLIGSLRTRSQHTIASLESRT